MDMAAGGSAYQDVCNKLGTWIDNPELTISGQLLELTKELGGLGKVGSHPPPAVACGRAGRAPRSAGDPPRGRGQARRSCLGTA